MRPLREVISRFGALHHQYADNTHLYLSFHASAMDAIPSLKCSLGTVLECMRVNRLRLNPDKIEVPQVGGTYCLQIGNFPLFGGVTLFAKHEVRSLGVILDHVLSMESQVAFL